VDFLDRLIDLALEEDLGAAGDITTRALVPPSSRGAAELWAKERLVLAGLDAFARTFQRVDASCSTDLLAQDGSEVKKGTVVARVSGPLHALLAGERTALNIAQRCSGIATMARQACRVVKGSKMKILDTRKTSPGMRGVSKDAVRSGGAMNHRFGLFDGVLIKDNHLAAVGGSIPEALRLAREGAPRLVKIEIEVTTLAQLEEAIAHGAHVVMLDNMTDAQIAKAVKISAGRVELEASGGVTLERLPKLAKLGVDYVSMGALTHSARAMDLSLEVRSQPGERQ
jgi:nicotinate-nucleotide pyrophosphorylase (carboxylating)